MDKVLVEEHKHEFVGAEIMKEALSSLINGDKTDAINAGKKLYAKEYQTRKEIKELENKIAKAQESLKKTTDKIAKVQSGDLSALFENDTPEEKK